LFVHSVVCTGGVYLIYLQTVYACRYKGAGKQSK